MACHQLCSSIYLHLLVCKMQYFACLFDALRLNQQFFSQVRTIPSLKHCQEVGKGSSLRTQHGGYADDTYETSNPV